MKKLPTTFTNTKYRYTCMLFSPLTSFRPRLQLFRGRLSEKNVYATIPKGNIGYVQYTVPDTVSVEPTFVAFL